MSVCPNVPGKMIAWVADLELSSPDQSSSITADPFILKYKTSSTKFLKQFNENLSPEFCRVQVPYFIEKKL